MHYPSVAWWCVAAVAVCLVVVLARQRWIVRRLRARLAWSESAVRAQAGEVSYLLTDRLPVLARSGGHPAAAADAPAARGVDADFAASIDAVVFAFASAVSDATARADAAVKPAVASVMRAVQSLAAEEQQAISLMQERHDDPDVLADLLRIDHLNSQLGRRAQAIAVLCGSWAGLTRSPASLTDVVRGGTSRVRDYRRVRVNTQDERRVVARVVEPVVLAVAELLDNAARHSEPGTAVEVCVQTSHNGVAIVIDDAGVGMTAEELRSAEVWLSGDREVDLLGLGDPPQTGFPTIGKLAAAHGFRVAHTVSPYGGVRAVVFLPSSLLAAPEPPQASGGPTTIGHPAEQQMEPSVTATGLPKRCRRTPNPHAGSSPALPAPTEPARAPDVVAAGVAAWQRGSRDGRSSAPIERES